MEAANGVFKPSYSPAEQLLMSGCTFNPSGAVTGGCGVGGDAILFTAAVTHIIPLKSLPEIVKDGVQFYGISGKTMIDFKSAWDLSGFRVYANSVYFYNLILINFGRDDPLIRLVDHKGLRLVGNYIGVTPTTTSCSDPALIGRPWWEVYIENSAGTAAAGDGTAYIYENVIGCSGIAGITIMGASYVYVGQDTTGEIRPNYFGVTPAGDNIGHSGIGILMDRPNQSTYTLQGNVITGNQIANCAAGISVQNTKNSLISKNNIHHNVWMGIEVIDSSTNTFTDNQVHHNATSGIYFKEINGSTFGNTVSGGTFYRNTTSGIATYGNLDKNRWTQVSTYENGGLGIDKGDNGIVNAPPLVVTGVTPQPKGYLVNGTFTTSSALSTNYTIELYRSTRDASGFGEGKIYLGSATYLKSAAGTYPWSIPDPLGAICYTATLTVSGVSDPAMASSSEFSANLGTMCSQVFIPNVRK
jgi:parallel beta-helix repeat protein